MGHYSLLPVQLTCTCCGNTTISVHLLLCLLRNVHYVSNLALTDLFTFNARILHIPSLS